jgi:hypothetical protein
MYVEKVREVDIRTSVEPVYAPAPSGAEFVTAAAFA